MRRIIHIVVALYFAAQGVDALRLGYADWLFAQGWTDEAAETNPGNAAYRTDPAEAAALNPHDAAAQIRLGLALEESGQFEAAERALVRASELSRKYEPRWTLAAFYARQNKIDPFWFWAEAAARVSDGHPDPLFELAWALENDGAKIRERLKVESRPSLWRAWVLHAARHGRVNELEAILDRAAGIEPALVAKALVAGGRVSALTRFGGHIELDWRPIPQTGIEYARTSSNGFELTFSGKQLEQCNVVTRLVAKPAARTAWLIEGPVRGLEWHNETFGDGLRVTLRYEKPAGQPNAVGKVRISE